jgi:hypothetical protein
MQRVLAAILMMQVTLSVVLLWPRRGSTETGGPLIPGLAQPDVKLLAISDGDGGRIELKAAGGAWVLSGSDDYPANGANVATALDRIAALDTRRLITRTSSSHKRLQVSADDYVRRIELQMSGGTRHVLYMGSSPSYGATHVRLDGQDATYLANDVTPWEYATSAASWIDTKFVTISEDELAAVLVDNALGRVIFNREESGEWMLGDLAAGENQADETVKTAVARASSIVMQAPLGKTVLAEHGLDRPLAVITLQLKDGDPVTVLVGAQSASDRSYVVQASISPYLVRVSEYSVKTLVENGRSAYLAPQVTPSPAP